MPSAVLYHSEVVTGICSVSGYCSEGKFHQIFVLVQSVLKHFNEQSAGSDVSTGYAYTKDR